MHPLNYSSLSDNFTLHLGEKPKYPLIPKEFEEKVFSKIAQDKPLFNGTLLCAHEKTSQGMSSYPITYKEYLASHHHPDYPFRHAVCAVSGYILYRNQILFGVRSSNVLNYEGYIELVPSGGIDERAILENQQVCFKTALIHEFEEETSFPATFIQKIEPKGLIYCPENHLYDICCLIQLYPDAPIDCSISTEEYSDLFWVPLIKLKSFVNDNKSKLIPTSLAIIEQNLIT